MNLSLFNSTIRAGHVIAAEKLINSSTCRLWSFCATGDPFVHVQPEEVNVSTYNIFFFLFKTPFPHWWCSLSTEYPSERFISTKVRQVEYRPVVKCEGSLGNMTYLYSPLAAYVEDIIARAPTFRIKRHALLPVCPSVQTFFGALLLCSALHDWRMLHGSRLLVFDSDQQPPELLRCNMYGRSKDDHLARGGWECTTKVGNVKRSSTCSNNRRSYPVSMPDRISRCLIVLVCKLQCQEWAPCVATSNQSKQLNLSIYLCFCR